MKRVRRLKNLLVMIGIAPERLEFFNLSAAQGPRWAEICTEFSAKITALGPSPIWFALRKNKPAENEQQPVDEANGGTTGLTDEGMEKL